MRRLIRRFVRTETVAVLVAAWLAGALAASAFALTACGGGPGEPGPRRRAR